MKQIKITYTNHKNETADFMVLPQSIWYGTTEWHPTEQWFLKAKDLVTKQRHDFAMIHINSMEYPSDEVPFIEDVTAPEQLIHTQNASDLSKAKLYADGGSRGNPGPSALGYAILDMEDNVVKKAGKYLGVTTNNQAEYQALEAGLQDALSMDIKELHVYMDSLLVINQVQGIWKIKNPDFIAVHANINALLKKFEKVTLAHVPRALNKIADSAVNECLDAQ
jgi:ribonuclease HI